MSQPTTEAIERCVELVKETMVVYFDHQNQQRKELVEQAHAELAALKGGAGQGQALFAQRNQFRQHYWSCSSNGCRNHWGLYLATLGLYRSSCNMVNS